MFSSDFKPPVVCLFLKQTVRVQGNAISHKLSLSNVRKEDEGVYECRVSDLYSDETQDYKVQATLRVTPRHGMLAEEAVIHIHNRWSLRTSNAESVGRTTPEPQQGKPRAPPVGGGLVLAPHTTPSPPPPMPTTQSRITPVFVTAVTKGISCS